jgi:hypothetical protein
MKDIRPLRAPNLASRVLHGEAIIMNPKDSSLFSLNETATAIWLAADGHTTLTQIVERHICPDYEVDFEQALLDAEELTRDLANHEILLIEGDNKVCR